MFMIDCLLLYRLLQTQQPVAAPLLSDDGRCMCPGIAAGHVRVVFNPTAVTFSDMGRISQIRYMVSRQLPGQLE